ncbi:hypothetical protein PAHAL_6G248700 [Panicum hallii]|uniref:Uncharacterized protein n=1 Tax=Panicum hallii TaxID=206008 RepID=A0A2T8IHH1_9POAL|nr:hypothetical protein PAHAL_6G248700 [Panicum hallii]
MARGARQRRGVRWRRSRVHAQHSGSSSSIKDRSRPPLLAALRIRDGSQLHTWFCSSSSSWALDFALRFLSKISGARVGGSARGCGSAAEVAGRSTPGRGAGSNARYSLPPACLAMDWRWAFSAPARSARTLGRAAAARPCGRLRWPAVRRPGRRFRGAAILAAARACCTGRAVPRAAWLAASFLLGSPTTWNKSRVTYPAGRPAAHGHVGTAVGSRWMEQPRAPIRPGCRACERVHVPEPRTRQALLI